MISLAEIAGREDCQLLLTALAERVANHVLADHCPDGTSRYHEETEGEVREALELTLASLTVPSFEEAVAEAVLSEGADLDREAAW